MNNDKILDSRRLLVFLKEIEKNMEDILDQLHMDLPENKRKDESTYRLAFQAIKNITRVTVSAFSIARICKKIGDPTTEAVVIQVIGALNSGFVDLMKYINRIKEALIKDNVLTEGK